MPTTWRALRNAGAALLGLLLVAPGTALAHPFGPPPSAIVSARGHSVFVEWQSAADDGIAVGVQVGLLPEELIQAYLEAPVQTAPSAAEEERLSRSPELQAYLLDNIVVLQDGEACAGTVQPIANFVLFGATVVLECPAPVTTVDIRITMLHDIHEAYRTFAVSTTPTDPGQAVFSVATPEHTWTFTPAAAAEATAVGGRFPVAALVGGVVVLLLLAGVVVLVGRGGASSP